MIAAAAYAASSMRGTCLSDRWLKRGRRGAGGDGGILAQALTADP